MKKTELTDEQLAIIDNFAGVIEKKRLADKLGISRSTFYDILERDEIVRMRFEKAETDAISEVATICYEKALSGDFKSMNLYLKCIAGWRESQEIEINSLMAQPKKLDDFYD